MKKIILFLSMLIIVHTQLLSQTTNNTLSGIVKDYSTNETIEFASIRVLNVADSSFVAGGSTGAKGNFSLSLKPANYIVRVSYLGFQDHMENVNLSQNVTLQNIFLKEDAVFLSEAVVEAKAIEIMVKGDTVEYNADSYKVQESAVVEDLLKKMPGVEIDSEGKITVNGKEVKKIMVDGKEFFSDDPKVASKNLPAKMVDKLQVLDQKSDMSLMTGFDDGNEETVINLTVKKGMKEGAFGSAMGGYGSEKRYEGAMNVNYMRDNTQVSYVGGVNNTNNAGSSDLSSAMLGNSGGGGRPRGLNFGGNNGVTRSLTHGVNFATEHSDKLKWGGNVRYGNNDNDVATSSIKDYTTSSKARKEISDSWGNNRGQSFASSFKFEWTPDSLTKVIFRPSFEYNTNDNIQGSDAITSFVEESAKDYSTITDYNSSGNGYKINGNLDLSRKLSSTGRVVSLGLRGGYNKSNSDGFDYTKIKYNAKSDSIIDQQFFQDDKSYNWRAFVSYVEPLSRNYFLELSYNISNNNSQTDKNTYYNINGEGVAPSYTEIDTLYTRFVKNDFLNQNVSLKFKGQHEKYNYTLGLGLEPSSSKTSIFEPGALNNILPRKTFLSLAPIGQFNYFWDKRSNIRLDYAGSTNQPTTLQLYDGVSSRSGMNTTSGNPDLRPSFENRFNVRFRKFNPEQASFMMVFGRLTFTTNDIVTTSVWNDEGGRDMTYRNVDGNMGGNLRFIFNKPLRNRNWSINSMSYVSYDISNTFISDRDANQQITEGKNKAKTLNLHENIGLQFRSDPFDFALRGNVQYRNMKNSISTNNNRNTVNYGGTYDFTARMPNEIVGFSTRDFKPFNSRYNFQFKLSDLTLDSDITYSTNSGYSDGFKQDEWLWNLSVSAGVFKDKFGVGTLRFKIYDVLQQRSNISRTYASDYIQDVTTNSIPSYFMVHFVYRFQFFKGGAAQGDMQQGEGRRGGHPGGRPH